MSGDVINLPTSLKNCDITGLNTVSGYIGDIPNSVITLNLGGNSAVSGDTSDIFSAMTIVVLGPGNNNFVSGNTSGFYSGMTNIYFNCNNTIFGDVINLPRKLGSTGLSGDGCLINGSNTISGNTADIPPQSNNFEINGFNTIDGSLSDLPPLLNNVKIGGNNTITGYTSGKVWNNPMNRLNIESSLPGVGFTNTNIDNILIDLSYTGTTWSGYYKNIVLVGIDVPKRTSASDAAVAYLTGSPRSVSITLL